MRAAFLALALAMAAFAPPSLAEPASPWALPAEGSCAPAGGAHMKPGAPTEDATSVPFKPGDTFAIDRLAVLERYIPDFMWTNRDRFFYEGMRLEIGPCFRNYGAPDFFEKATEAGRGKAKLDANGGLTDWTAGLPFAPADIAPDAKDAGMRWLWNVQSRYQAAGFRGPFRMTDLVGKIGRAEPFEGEIFKLITANRADRPGYEAPGAKDRMSWPAASSRSPSTRASTRGASSVPKRCSPTRRAPTISTPTCRSGGACVASTRRAPRASTCPRSR